VQFSNFAGELRMPIDLNEFKELKRK